MGGTPIPMRASKSSRARTERCTLTPSRLGGSFKGLSRESPPCPQCRVGRGTPTSLLNKRLETLQWEAFGFAKLPPGRAPPCPPEGTVPSCQLGQGGVPGLQAGEEEVNFPCSLASPAGPSCAGNEFLSTDGEEGPAPTPARAAQAVRKMLGIWGGGQGADASGFGDIPGARGMC